MQKKLQALILVALAAPVNGADFGLMEKERQARAVVQEFGTELRAALLREMAAGGPVAAIKVCKEIAPALAGRLSRAHGGRVSRVSLKLRNPLLGSPDAWEQAVLLEFDQRAAATAKGEALDFDQSAIVAEPSGEYFRYMRSIPVAPVCLSCHGAPATIAPDIRAGLEENYPHDRATGYALGELRGAFTVKFRIGEELDPIEIDGAGHGHEHGNSHSDVEPRRP
jgi:hypothetical protein